MSYYRFLVHFQTLVKLPKLQTVDLNLLKPTFFSIFTSIFSFLVFPFHSTSHCVLMLKAAVALKPSETLEERTGGVESCPAAACFWVSDSPHLRLPVRLVSLMLRGRLVASRACRLAGPRWPSAGMISFVCKNATVCCVFNDTLWYLCMRTHSYLCQGGYVLAMNRF